MANSLCRELLTGSGGLWELQLVDLCVVRWCTAMYSQPMQGEERLGEGQSAESGLG